MTHLVKSLVILTAACVSSVVTAQQTIEYTARYEASANGISARARRTLTKTGESSYSLTNTLNAEVLNQVVAKLEQSSQFELSAGRIIPHSYSYLVSGISRGSKTVQYNWDAGVALSTEDDDSWTIQLAGNELDQLSHQFAMRQLLRTSTETEFEFNLVDEDEVELHRYRRVADEVLETPLGKLNTIKLERIREQSDSRSTEIWLARDWDLLLVRIDQVNGSGLRIKLELDRAVVAGVEVTALP